MEIMVTEQSLNVIFGNVKNNNNINKEFGSSEEVSVENLY